jgi:GcrA cell cycle regulator
MPWDAAKIKQLEILWASGHSASRCARRLGVSRNAVCAKVKRLRLPPRSTLPARPVKPLPQVELPPPSPSPPQMSPQRTPRPQEVEVNLTKKELYEMLAQAVRNTPVRCRRKLVKTTQSRARNS